MKKSLIVAGILLASTGALAQNEVFIGADYVNAAPSFTLGLSVNDEAEASGSLGVSSDSNVNFKVGMITDNTHRFTLSTGKLYDKAFVDDDETINAEFKLTSIGYDYLFKADNIQPYLGAFAGIGKLDLGATDVNFSDSGMVYGVRAGAIFNITKNIGLEVGAAYAKTDVKPEVSMHDGADRVNLWLEVDDVTSYYIGLNYKF